VYVAGVGACTKGVQRGLVFGSRTKLRTVRLTITRGLQRSGPPLLHPCGCSRYRGGTEKAAEMRHGRIRSMPRTSGGAEGPAPRGDPRCRCRGPLDHWRATLRVRSRSQACAVRVRSVCSRTHEPGFPMSDATGGSVVGFVSQSQDLPAVAAPSPPQHPTTKQSGRMSVNAPREPIWRDLCGFVGGKLQHTVQQAVQRRRTAPATRRLPRSASTWTSVWGQETVRQRYLLARVSHPHRRGFVDRHGGRPRGFPDAHRVSKGR
jgi:hypothetical protein